MATTDLERGTGRTSRQLQAAPPGAVFVWCNDRLAYVRDLARARGREDLKIVGLSALDSRHPASVRVISRRFALALLEAPDPQLGVVAIAGLKPADAAGKSLFRGETSKSRESGREQAAAGIFRRPAGPVEGRIRAGGARAVEHPVRIRPNRVTAERQLGAARSSGRPRRRWQIEVSTVLPTPSRVGPWPGRIRFSFERSRS